MNQGTKIKNAILVQKRVKDVLFVKIPEFVKGYMTLEILKMDGIKVFENILQRDSNNIIEIPLNSIENGTYLLHINTGDSFAVDTFVKG